MMQIRKTCGTVYFTIKPASTINTVEQYESECTGWFQDPIPKNTAQDAEIQVNVDREIVKSTEEELLLFSVYITRHKPC